MTINCKECKSCNKKDVCKYIASYENVKNVIKQIETESVFVANISCDKYEPDFVKAQSVTIIPEGLPLPYNPLDQ